MKQYLLPFIILFLLPAFSLKAGDNYHVGARSSALADASVTNVDVWSAENNQAGLAFVHNISGAVYYQERFMLKELGLKAAAFALPVKGGTFGLSMTSFGYSKYSENKYGLAFAKSFGPDFSAAVQMDYLNTKIAESYGSKGVFVAEAGIRAQVIPNMMIGVHIFNPTRTQLATYANEYIPTIMQIGTSYAFSKQVTLIVEAEKDIDYKTALQAGIEYKANDKFCLRAGVSNNPNFVSFGFGMNLKDLVINISASIQPVLGYTPGMDIGYEQVK